MNARAQYTARMVSLHRAMGTAKKPRKRLPVQLSPRPIEREYAKAILVIIREIHEALAPLIAEIPRLMKSAALDRRMDGVPTMPAMALGSGPHLVPTAGANVAPGGNGAAWQGVAAMAGTMPGGPALDEIYHTDVGEEKKIRELADAAREKLKASINTTRLEAIADKFGTRTSLMQKEQLTKQLRSAIGVNILAQDRGLRPIMNGFVQENVALIKGLPEQIISRVETTISKSVARGGDVRSLSKELAEKFDIDEGRAKRIARDQIGSLYGQINASRQQELGVSRFIWRTVGDDVVRPEHEARDGETFNYDDPPEDGLPGEPINCRCWAEPVLGDILEEVV